MARRQPFLRVEWSDPWMESYSTLPSELQSACDRAAMDLIKRQFSPGLRVKPILPDKHYLEARISSGHRIIFRIGGGTVYFVDVVSHDDIGRYGRRPRGER